MVVTFTNEAMRRLDEQLQERTLRLARQAYSYTTEPDERTGGTLVRDERIPGHMELVKPSGECTCRQYQIWDRCPHSAYVRLMRQDTTLRILEGGRA